MAKAIGTLDLTPILEVSEAPPVIMGHYSYVKELNIENNRNLLFIHSISFDSVSIGDGSTIQLL